MDARQHRVLFAFLLSTTTTCLSAQTLMLPLRNELTGQEIVNLTTMSWGSGFSSQTGEFRGDCLDWKGKSLGDPVPREKRSAVRSQDAQNPQQSALLGGVRIEDSQGNFKAQSYENTSLAASMAQGAYSGSANYTAVTNTSSSQFERNLMIVAAARFESELLNVSLVVPGKSFTALLKSGKQEEFYKKCGDYFVKGIIFGGRIAAKVHLKATSFHSFSSVNQKFNAAMNAAMTGSMSMDQKKEFEEFKATNEYNFQLIPDAILAFSRPLPTDIDSLFKSVQNLPETVKAPHYTQLNFLLPVP